MTHTITADITTMVGGVNLTSLPKVALHDHLDGGMRPRTVVELARQVGRELPTSQPDELAQWMVRQASGTCLEDYLRTFEITVSLLQTAPSLTRVAREAVEDLASDGVMYAELRWAPQQHCRGELTPDRAIHAVQLGIEQGIDHARQAGRRIDARQILCGLRHTDDIGRVAELAVRHRDTGVVGFDLAGPESGFTSKRFREVFDYLLTQCVPVTIHAGEADGLASVRSALVDCHALRIGHGVRIAEDIRRSETENGDQIGEDVGQLAQWLVDRQIPLELCPSSNLQTGAISRWGSQIREHPFDSLYSRGLAVTVNTDNRLMSGTTYTREWALLATAFGYGLQDLLHFQLNAAAGAFLPVSERRELAEKIRSGFALASAAQSGTSVPDRVLPLQA